MLVLTRRAGQSIMIGHDVVITVLEIRGDQVRLGIQAPRARPDHPGRCSLPPARAVPAGPGAPRGEGTAWTKGCAEGTVWTRREARVARVAVDVMLKPEILDPQGQAVERALPSLGFDGVSDVRVGKHVELTVRDGDARAAASAVAEALLANPVIEEFTVRVLPA